MTFPRIGPSATSRRGVVDPIQRETVRVNGRSDMMAFDDLRNPVELCSVGMHEHKPVLLALSAGCPVVFHPGQREEHPLVPRKAASPGKLPVGSGPQAQQTSSRFQHREFVLELSGAQRVMTRSIPESFSQ